MNMSKANRGDLAKTPKSLPIIGASEWVTIGKYQNIPAKTDTGAQSSAIWASDISMSKDGVLSFKLFDAPYPLYTGRVFKRTPGNYKVGVIRSSNGQEEIRYRVYLPLKINNTTIRVLFSLTDRSKNNYPILIGRRSISGKFLVDPSLQRVTTFSVDTHNPSTTPLNTELSADPFKFHQKYVINKKERS
ncbi:ATP-dependent zinc protease [Candidatus Saccharibacteria bacterium]|nr:ATP-dependent zinc protease [Candidatus Saccharibacteria bacterium]